MKTKLSTPSITPAQIVAAIAAVVAQAIAYQLLDAGTGQLLVSIAGVVVPVVFLIADAIIRHGRVRITVAQIESEATNVVALLHHFGLVHEVEGASVAGAAETAKAALVAAKSA